MPNVGLVPVGVPMFGDPTDRIRLQAGVGIFDALSHPFVRSFALRRPSSIVGSLQAKVSVGPARIHDVLSSRSRTTAPVRFVFRWDGGISRHPSIISGYPQPYDETGFAPI